MRITMFEVDGHKFDTIKEARAFRANPENNLDPEFPIRTVLYESEEKKAKDIESIDFEACGTDWESSDWMMDYSYGKYKGQIGDGIYVSDCDEDFAEGGCDDDWDF